MKLVLTHWGQVTHICVDKLNTIGPYNGLSPGRRQAWTNAGILLIVPLRTNFSEILSEIHTFTFIKMPLKMSSAKWRPFCFGLNVLNEYHRISLMISQQAPSHYLNQCWPISLTSYVSLTNNELNLTVFSQDPAAWLINLKVKTYILFAWPFLFLFFLSFHAGTN